MKNYKGFTLVELLVVVAIIAILSVIGLTIFSGAQANARDARRKSDIEAIANAIETTKGVATTTYSPTTTNSFSGGAAPKDNPGIANKPNYCIRVAATDTPAINDPTEADTGWTATEACEDTTNWSEFDIGKPVATTKLWKVCARLENAPAGKMIFCKGSAQ